MASKGGKEHQYIHRRLDAGVRLGPRAAVRCVASVDYGFQEMHQHGIFLRSLAFHITSATDSFGPPKHQFHFWAAISSFDILTELVMVILPMIIVNPVQVAVSKKATVVVAFIFRIAQVPLYCPHHCLLTS